MTREQVLAKVSDMMVDMFDLEPAKVVPAARLVDDLDLDSIDAIDMVAKLHEMTGKRVEEGALRSIRTVGDVVDLVVAQLEAKTQG